MTLQVGLEFSGLRLRLRGPLLFEEGVAPEWLGSLGIAALLEGQGTKVVSPVVL